MILSIKKSELNQIKVLQIYMDKKIEPKKMNEEDDYYLNLLLDLIIDR